MSRRTFRLSNPTPIFFSWRWTCFPWSWSARGVIRGDKYISTSGLLFSLLSLPGIILCQMSVSLPPFTQVSVCACSDVSDYWRSHGCSHQAPLSMEFSMQEYWSGLPFPTVGDLPNPRITPKSLVSPALAGRFFTTIANWEALSSRPGIKSMLVVVKAQSFNHWTAREVPIYSYSIGEFIWFSFVL